MGCKSSKSNEIQADSYGPSGFKIKLAEEYNMGKVIANSKCILLICNRIVYEYSRGNAYKEWGK